MGVDVIPQAVLRVHSPYRSCCKEQLSQPKQAEEPIFLGSQLDGTK